MSRTGLVVAVTGSGDDVVIAIRGELDLSTVEQLTDAVHAELGPKPARLVVDLAAMSFCDSRGLGTLVVLNRAAQAQRTVLVLCNPSQSFIRTLELTGLRDALTVVA